MFRRHKHPQDTDQTTDHLGNGSRDDGIWYRPTPRSIPGGEGAIPPPSSEGENALLSAYVASVEGCSVERPERCDSNDSIGSGRLSLSPEEESRTDLQTLIKRKAWKYVIKRLEEHPGEAIRYQSVQLYELSGAGGDDSQRALPIHLAMTLHPPSIVIEKFIKAYPYCARMIDEKYGRLPLHFGCIDSAGVNCLSVLVRAFPEGAMVKDNSGGRLPLHYACIWGTVPEVMVILNAYPAARFAKDGGGKTPLVLAQDSGNTNKVSIVRVLQTRLEDGNGHQNANMRSDEMQGEADSSLRDEGERCGGRRRTPRPRNKSPKPPTGLESPAADAVTRCANMSGRGELLSRECSPFPRSPQPTSDPHNLYDRFVEPQIAMFSTALKEIRDGYKRSCWLWFILPTAPYIVDGIERGSSMNRLFALRGDDAVRAFLRFRYDNGRGKVVDLRRNYLEIVMAIRDQLAGGNTMSDLFGPMDDVNALSSFRLFERIAGTMEDEELLSVCQEVLDLVDKKKKKKTETSKSRGRRSRDLGKCASGKEELLQSRVVSSIAPSDSAQTGGALCATISGSENRDQHSEQRQQVVNMLINELLLQKVELSNHLSDLDGIEQEIEKLDVKRNALAGTCAKFEQTARSNASSVASSKGKLDELNQKLEALFVTIEKEKAQLKKAEQDLKAEKQKILGHRKQIAAVENEKVSLEKAKDGMLEECARKSQRAEQIDAEIKSLIAVDDLVCHNEEGSGHYVQSF